MCIVCVQKYLLLPRVAPLHGSGSSFGKRMLHHHRGTASTKPQRKSVAVARQQGRHGGLAIGWQSPACCLRSPLSALQGAEQSRFSLGIWHATRASPLPIRPPTHLHPSPIQTLLAINKQSKCQPAPGKSPRQLHPIWRVQEQLPRAIPAQASTEHGPGHGLGIPPATPWSSCQWLACTPEQCYPAVSPGCSQHDTSTKSLSVHTTHYVGMIQHYNKGLFQLPSPKLPNFPSLGFCRKAPAWH